MAFDYRKDGMYVGHPDQLMTLHEGYLLGGYKEGVRFMEVHNGGNVSAMVLPGRCMDIYQVRYKGQNLNFIGNGGITAAPYYDARSNRWLRSFFAGMLTTMGLQNMGGAYTDASGDERGQHGRIANTPAENVFYERGCEEGIPTITLCGTMREASLGRGNFTLKRVIRFRYGEDAIDVADTITNHDYETRPFTYGLHLNYGYPLLEEGTRLLFEAQESIALDEGSMPYLKDCHVMEAPRNQQKNLEFLHKLKTDGNGLQQYTVFNEKRQLGVRVTCSGTDFPVFNEWKYLGKGEYVVALEPTVMDMDGPKLGQPGCPAPELLPGESKTYNYRLEFVDRL